MDWRRILRLARNKLKNIKLIELNSSTQITGYFEIEDQIIYGRLDLEAHVHQKNLPKSSVNICMIIIIIIIVIIISGVIFYV